MPHPNDRPRKRIALDERNFRCLVSGGRCLIPVDDIDVEIILSDIGFAVMRNALDVAIDESQRDDEEPDPEPGPQTYCEKRIYSAGTVDMCVSGEVTGEGPVVVRIEDNDDNDDGYPDAEVSVYYLRFPTVKAAVKLTGIDRHGLYGQPVRVLLDGETLTKERAVELGLL